MPQVEQPADRLAGHVVGDPRLRAGDVVAARRCRRRVRRPVSRHRGHAHLRQRRLPHAASRRARRSGSARFRRRPGRSSRARDAHVSELMPDPRQPTRGGMTGGIHGVTLARRGEQQRFDGGRAACRSVCRRCPAIDPGRASRRFRRARIAARISFRRSATKCWSRSTRETCAILRHRRPVEWQRQAAVQAHCSIPSTSAPFARRPATRSLLNDAGDRS